MLERYRLIGKNEDLQLSRILGEGQKEFEGLLDEREAINKRIVQSILGNREDIAKRLKEMGLLNKDFDIADMKNQRLVLSEDGVLYLELGPPEESEVDILGKVFLEKFGEEFGF